MASSVGTKLATSSTTSAASSTLKEEEETADEVKVFRSSANNVDDPNDLAGSSADLNADKQELAFEADLEAGESHTERINPIFNQPLPWLSPGAPNLNLFAQMLLSPVYVAQQAAALATAYLVRNSPNYAVANPFAPTFERPPAFFSQPCTPSTNAARNGPMQQPQLGLNNPMSSMFGGLAMSADRATNGLAAAAQQQRHNLQQQQQQLTGSSTGLTKTPKRDKLERNRGEKSHHHKEHHHRMKAAVESSENGSGKSSNNKNKQEPHVKKPMNAFMLFMNMNRDELQKKYGDKRMQSAELNKELGQLWQQMSKEEQKPYYEIANQRKEEHQRLYPNWTARDNYAIHAKKTVKKRQSARERSPDTNNEQKKCRARFGVDNQAKWCKHCRRKKRCLNVRESASPVQVSSTTHPITSHSSMAPTTFSANANGGGGGGNGIGTGIGSNNQFAALGINAANLFGHQMSNGISQQHQLDSPHSSRKDCGGQSTSELSRCSSTTSSGTTATSAASMMMMDEGGLQQQQQQHHNQQHAAVGAPGTTTMLLLDNKHEQPLKQLQSAAQQNGLTASNLTAADMLLPKPVPTTPSMQQQQQQSMSAAAAAAGLLSSPAAASGTAAPQSAFQMPSTPFAFPFGSPFLPSPFNFMTPSPFMPKQ